MASGPSINRSLAAAKISSASMFNDMKFEVKASLIVVLATVIFPVTLATTYIIALYNKHIVPFWPYISHTGDDPIESCFFSLGLNIVSGLYILIVYLRFVQIRSSLARVETTSKYLKYLNVSSLVWGTIAALALSMTSSFQQRNGYIIHPLVAVICSYATWFYCCHQTVFSYIVSKWVTKRTKMFRTVLCIVSTVLHATGPFLGLYFFLVHTIPDRKINEWDGENMAIYLTGSFLEWFVFVLNEMYIASLYWEFQKITLEPGQIVVDFDGQDV